MQSFRRVGGSVFYVYALYSRLDNKFYIGFTRDLKARVKKHQEKGNHSTKRFKNIELVYYEACRDEKDARKREIQLKTGFGRSFLRNRVKSYLDNLNK